MFYCLLPAPTQSMLVAFHLAPFAYATFRICCCYKYYTCRYVVHGGQTYSCAHACTYIYLFMHICMYVCDSDSGSCEMDALSPSWGLKLLAASACLLVNHNFYFHIDLLHILIVGKWLSINLYIIMPYTFWEIQLHFLRSEFTKLFSYANLFWGKVFFF